MSNTELAGEKTWMVIARDNDGTERVIGRYHTHRGADLRMRRLLAMMAAEVEYS
jgi:hypothetical protein